MDQQYTVLARRFRPQTFTEVVGQERIAKTLRNAIREGRVAHAYLFTGARGVGKTSMARIFAKALNCKNLSPEGVPCNECEICRGISAGQDVDVSEIDGASNRGIDDIRALRANVGIKSMRSSFKVYIIDEVHMLTKEAFNALLKTLEEPPPAVKFIFCTTEPNKVPDTILSRCQRFDFGTISVTNIALRLKQLAEAEGFEVEDAALDLVARRAAGSMRDSQSLFDQLLAFGSRTVTSADVHRLFGTASDDRVVEIVRRLIARDRAGALTQFEDALNDGVQVEALTDQLVGYFRDLMILACGAETTSLVSVGEDRRGDLQQQAQQWGLQTVVAGMQIMADTKARMQRVTFGRALAELALVRISMLEDLSRLDELIARLSDTSPLPVVPRTPQSGTPPDEKKNDLAEESERPRSSQPEVQRPSSAPPEVFHPITDVPESVPQSAPEPTIEWKPSCEKELHAAVLGRLNDMTGTHLSRVARVAISGPTQLDFIFPANYDFDRKQCDRVEVVNKVEQIVQELVGQRIRVRFLLSEASVREPVKSPVAAPAASSSKSRFLEMPDDPFLQQLSEVFGIKVWKAQVQGSVIARPDQPAAEEEG